MRASPTNLALLGLMDRGMAASDRAKADRYEQEQARMLEVLTRPVPVVKAPGMPEPADGACLEHLASRMVPDGSGTLLIGTHCGCVMESRADGVRAVIRRGE